MGGTQKSKCFSHLCDLREPDPVQKRIMTLSSCTDQLRLQSLEPATQRHDCHRETEAHRAGECASREMCPETCAYQRLKSEHTGQVRAGHPREK